MLTVSLDPPRETAECPNCRNREGLRDGASTPGRRRKYDVLTDTFGLVRCPRCGRNAGWSDFHRPKKENA